MLYFTTSKSEKHVAVRGWTVSAADQEQCVLFVEQIWRDGCPKDCTDSLVGNKIEIRHFRPAVVNIDLLFDAFLQLKGRCFNRFQLASKLSGEAIQDPPRG